MEKNRLLNTATQHMRETIEEVRKDQVSFAKLAKDLSGVPAEAEFKAYVVGMELAIRKFEKVFAAMEFNNGDSML